MNVSACSEGSLMQVEDVTDIHLLSFDTQRDILPLISGNFTYEVETSTQQKAGLFVLMI